MQSILAVHDTLDRFPFWQGRFGWMGELDIVTDQALEDSELVTRFQAGDRAAFTELFRRHQPSVSRLIARMLGASTSRASRVIELEDLVQDVFVQVYRSLAQFRGSSKVGTWIYRIAVNVVLMHRRSTRARPHFFASDDFEMPASPELIPDDEVTRRSNVEALYRLLAQLGEKKRTVYVLHELEGLSPSEISEIVQAPVLTVRTRLFYARRELLRLLRDDPHLSALLDELDAEDSRVRARGGSTTTGPAMSPPVPEDNSALESACLPASRPVPPEALTENQLPPKGPPHGELPAVERRRRQS